MALSKIDVANMLTGEVPNDNVAKLPASKLEDDINFRNIIINGDMSINQRNTSVSSLGNGNSGYHTCDRWKFKEQGSESFLFTMSKDTDVPTGQGFSSSLKLDCTTADTSIASSGSLRIQQFVEGQNLQYLKKGTSSAESLTVSFWIKSTKTGTYILELYDSDNTRQISKSYTVSASNTWEKKTITFAGDTSGAFDNDNAASLELNFWLVAGSNYNSGTLNTSWNSVTAANRAVGQVNISDSTSNEWYITGVQLEAGTAASDFEFLPVDVNTYRCKRYFYKTTANQWLYSLNSGANYNRSEVVFRPSMRATPTSTVSFSNTYSGSGTQNENVNHVTVFVNGVGSGDTSLQSGATFDAEL
jgi:hypothetical protein